MALKRVKLPFPHVFIYPTFPIIATRLYLVICIPIHNMILYKLLKQQDKF